jgi:hypothetical protein
MLKHLHGPKSDEYKTQFRELRFNLGDSANEDLNRKIADGSFTFDRVATCSSKDLASEAKAQEIEKNVRENMESARTDWEKERWEKERMEKMMTCPQCKGTKSTLDPITKDCVSFFWSLLTQNGGFRNVRFVETNGTSRKKLKNLRRRNLKLTILMMKTTLMMVAVEEMIDD